MTNEPSVRTLPAHMEPGRFVERVSLETGDVIDPPPCPDELLVHGHRDTHVVDVQARVMLSREVRRTGSERQALARLRRMRGLARDIATRTARVLRRDPDRLARWLFGIEQPETFFRFKRPEHTSRAWAAQVLALVRDAEARLDAVRDTTGRPRLVMLLTGATGFIGKEIIWQAARDDRVAAVYAVIRPRLRVDRETGEMVVARSAEERGTTLLDRLGIHEPAQRAKLHFVAGDVEQPRFGIDDQRYAELATNVTHLVHCAASVAFDAPYDASFRANVVGTLNALALSRDLYRADGSAFVTHVGIETSYIHGRRLLALAREDTLAFPTNYYNNFYELTKAMASIETERFMLDESVPVVQLCPSIVIGDQATGNNRGDTKVVNAPVNLFGRAGEAMIESGRSLKERSKVAMLARLAAVFPSDPSAQINLIPVDRVAAGVLAALGRPKAVGRRVHLANDRRITARDIATILHEELGVKVRLVEPTLHRTVGLPVMGKILDALGAGRLVRGARQDDGHLRWLRRMGPAGPRGGQRRPPARPRRRTPGSPRRLPHALPPQPLGAALWADQEARSPGRARARVARLPPPSGGPGRRTRGRHDRGGLPRCRPPRRLGRPGLSAVMVARPSGG